MRQRKWKEGKEKTKRKQKGRQGKKVTERRKKEEVK